MFEFLNKHGENIKDAVSLIATGLAIFGLISINTPEMSWQLQGLGTAGLLLSLPIIVAFGLSKPNWN